MSNEEAIKILNEDLEMWARVLGKLDREGDWFQEVLLKVRALRVAIKTLKENRK